MDLKTFRERLTINGESKEIQEERYAIFSLSEVEAGRNGRCAESNLCLLTFRSSVLKNKMSNCRHPFRIYNYKLNIVSVFLFTKINIWISNNFRFVVWV